MEPIEMLGIAAALVTLSAFAANQYGLLSADDIRYDAANAAASACLFMYAYSTDAIPFMLTSAVWGGISAMDVIRRFTAGPSWHLKKGG